jgi:uncharacterized membrane protein
MNSEPAMAKVHANVPQGWRHNPSSQSKRLLIEVLALTGLAISLYLALFQFGVAGPVWDPIFGSASSAAILHSSFSRALPVPDALLGAIAYLIEFVLSRMGDQRRWENAPWIVALNGCMALALTLAALLLVSLQAWVFSHWCLLCLCSAASSIAIGLLTVDEVYATVLYLQAIRRAGGNVLLAFAGKGEEALLYARFRPAA